jgi:RNA polymerase-interacting CarD/CdnL/TRCF family regulator
MKLAVGDSVVYGSHGVGRVVARTKERGAGEIIVLELGVGLTVTLPLERARERLRPVASKADVRLVQQTLREDRRLSLDPWLSRRRETMEKLSTGTLTELAEIVCEGSQRDRARLAGGNASRLPTAERSVFVKARERLSEEIAVALSLQPNAADEWIEAQLARPD